MHPHKGERAHRHAPLTYTRPDPDPLEFPGTDGQPLCVWQVHGHAPLNEQARAKQGSPAPAGSNAEASQLLSKVLFNPTMLSRCLADDSTRAAIGR